MGYKNNKLITLIDEKGNKIKFNFLDLLHLEGEDFAVLLPGDADDESGELVILRVKYDEEEKGYDFYTVEDEDTIQTVCNIFRDKYKDEFNFTD